MNWFEWNKQRAAWRDAPAWARRLRDDLAYITLQNEVMLALLQQRPSKLSPEDQAKVDEIFAIEKADQKKIDDTLAK